MEKADLTIVPSSTLLAAALQKMRDSGHAAVLAHMDGGLRIVTSDEVFGQLRRHRETPQTLAALSTSRWPSFLPPSAAEESWTRRPETTHGLSFALESGEGKYAILKIGQSSARVMTADPILAEAFNTRVSLCRCRLHPDSHVFQPDELVQPGKCNLDPSDVDCE